MPAVDRPDNGQDELDAVVQTIAAMYRDPEVARYAMNDLRDWLSGDREAPSTAVRAALRAANLPLASGRAGAGEQQREQVEALIRRYNTGKPSWSVAEFADELLALLGRTGMDTGMDKVAISGPLDRTQPDDDPGPQCPSTSHGTDGGWRCEHRAGHDPKVKHKNREVEW